MGIILWVLALISVVYSQQCSSGLTTLYNNNQIVTCNPQSSTSCSQYRAGYFCQMASTGNTFICCGSQSQQCGTNSPQIGSNGQIQTCSTDTNCLSGYSCTSGVCCPSSNTGTVQIGGYCTDTVQCYGGSSCFNQQCTCPTGTTNTNGQCLKGNSNGNCQSNQVLVNGICYQTSYLGGQCTFSQQCPTNGQCSNSICSCMNGYQNLNGQCTSNGNNGCQNGQVLVNGICYQTSYLGGQCTFSQQCPTNGQCSNSICSCMNGYQNLNGQCTSNGNNGCQNGQVLINGICYQTSYLGGQCTFSQQCPTNGQCSNSICSCMSGYLNNNGQCTYNGGSSNCQLGQVLVNGQCMSYSSPGAYCISSTQCLEGAQCQNSVCVCQSGKTQLNGYCIAYSGGPCSQTQTYYNGQCYTYSLPGATCNAPTQCVGGANCTSSLCQCQMGYTSMYGYCIVSNNNNGVTCPSGQVAISGQCYNMVSLGGYCIYTQQCQSGTCQNNICTNNGQNGCQTGQVMINNICYNQVQQGGYCVYTQQCSCQNNICQGSSSSCGVNKVLINNLCYDQVSIGNSCSFTQQCLGGSTCTNGFCQCPMNSQNINGYCNYNNGTGSNCQSYQVYVNNQCYSKMPITSTCTITQQCPTGSACTNGRCQCNSGTTYDGTQCSTGIMTCGTGYVSYSGQCRALRSLGQSCSVNQECLAFAQCQNSMCNCATGSQLDTNQVCRAQSQNSQCGTNAVLINNQCYPTAYVGGSCQFTQQCLGNSQCSNFLCQCPSGTTNSGGTCTNGGSSGQYTCSKTNYYAPLQNGQPINCLFNYCPDQYNSICEYNYQVQYYICCTSSSSSGK
ncbi:unnamed protein product, partial [Mesorhabditis spiculigera]